MNNEKHVILSYPQLSIGSFMRMNVRAVPRFAKSRHHSMRKMTATLQLHVTCDSKLIDWYMRTTLAFNVLSQRG